MWPKAVVVVILFGATLVWSQFYCHDDPAFDPDEGPITEVQFTWLGALQYIHVKNGTPHYFRVPRVILVSRQFVLSTAEDAAKVPPGYALGNVVFGEYERDEEECKASVADLVNRRAECEPAILVMPLADVLVHPEYKHFGARSSIALLKLILPVKSKYVLPVCLPFKDFLVDRSGKPSREKLYHIDFASDVPRDFIEEDKEVTRIAVVPRELCNLPENIPKSDTDPTSDRIACTTGCGLRSGAPSVVHEHTGHWSVVSLAEGGSPCPDPLFARRSHDPSRHILLYPYLPWITTAITGKAIGAFFRDDPFGFGVARAVAPEIIPHVWVGHWWIGGVRCYDRGETSHTMFRFYHEVFQIKPLKMTYLTYYLESRREEKDDSGGLTGIREKAGEETPTEKANLSSKVDTVVVCVKVGMPHQLGIPMLWGIDSPDIKLRIPLVVFDYAYKFQVEAWATNLTDSSTYESEEEQG